MFEVVEDWSLSERRLHIAELVLGMTEQCVDPARPRISGHGRTMIERRQSASLSSQDIIEGVVLEKGGVKITAFEVDHTPIKPAFGYRIDHAGRSVKLSGDTVSL